MRIARNAPSLSSIGERKHPARADDRALRVLADVIVAADQHAGRVLRRLQPRDHFGERNAFPFGHAHQAEVDGLLPLPEHSNRCGPIFFDSLVEIVELQRPPAARAGRWRRASTAPGGSAAAAGISVRM